MAQPIRVMVANQPRLMRDLVVETLSGQPDIEIVAEIQDETSIMKAVDTFRPDFLIVTLEEPTRRPAICDIVLHRYPEMKILAVASRRSSSIFFWASFDIHGSPVEASQAGILKTLRAKGECVGGGKCA